MKRVTNPTPEQIVEKYREGLTIRQVAQFFGIARGTVSARLRAADVETRPRRHWSSIRASVALYESGVSSNEIARQFSIHGTTVREHLRAAGVAIRPHTKLSDEDVRTAARLRGEGWTIIRLAERFGVARSTVQRSLARQSQTEQ
jgi:DNA-binding CsgD family transcriptional regulator